MVYDKFAVIVVRLPYNTGVIVLNIPLDVQPNSYPHNGTGERGGVDRT